MMYYAVGNSLCIQTSILHFGRTILTLAMTPCIPSTLHGIILLFTSATTQLMAYKYLINFIYYVDNEFLLILELLVSFFTTLKNNDVQTFD